MQSIKGCFAIGTKGGLLGALVALAAIAAAAGTASAQTYGFATLPPGTLNHTTASAISKVLKEKAGMNVLVQPTAGDNVIIPMVGRGEAEIGIANAPEIAAALEGGRQRELRLIGTAHPLRTPSGCARMPPCAPSPISKASGSRQVIRRCGRSIC